MNLRSLIAVSVSLIWFTILNASAIGQQSGEVEAKKALIHEFRKLTGADNVNLSLDITLDETKKELADKVKNAKGLPDEQRRALEKAVTEAGERLDAQLKSFMDDRTRITDLAEAAVIEIYDKAFTPDELKQLIAYYQTDLGQRGLKFLRNQNTEFNSAFQNRMIAVLSESFKPKIKAEFDLLDRKINGATKITN